MIDKPKRKREITAEFIRTRFYVLYHEYTEGQRQGVREALKAIDLLAKGKKGQAVVLEHGGTLEPLPLIDEECDSTDD